MPTPARAAATVSPSVRAFENSTAIQPVRVWVFFRGRGFSDSAQRSEALARVALSPRASVRRAQRAHLGAGADVYDLPVNPAYLRDVAATGCRIRFASKYLNAASVLATPEQVAALARLDAVRHIDRVASYRREPMSPGEPVSRSALRAASPAQTVSDDYGPSRRQVDQIDVIPLHDAGYHGEGILMAFLDSGFNLAHESLAHVNVVAQYDFVFDDSVTSNQPGDRSDQQTHGTWVLSTALGYAPGMLIGTAWAADVILAKTERVFEEVPGEEDDFVRGLEWADSIGADVVSTSLGYFNWYSYPDIDGNTAVTTVACDIAASRGITVVASAGNPANTLPWPGITPPADGDSVIAVGAVDSLGAVASFSSRGPTYDGRIKPDVMAMGVSVLVASSTVDTLYFRQNGTSFSAPLTAGACALLLQMHPTWGPAEVIAALRSEASNTATPDNTYGWGVIDAYRSATSGATGSITGMFVRVTEEDEGLRVRAINGGAGDVTVDVVRRRQTGVTTWSPPEIIATARTVASGRELSLLDPVGVGVWEYRAQLSGDPRQATAWGAGTVLYALALGQSAPNPFVAGRGDVTISFTLDGGFQELSPSRLPARRTELSLYNVRGALVRQLFSQPLGPGDYDVGWDGTTDGGDPVASGVYFYRLRVESKSVTRRMVLVR